MPRLPRGRHHAGTCAEATAKDGFAEAVVPAIAAVTFPVVEIWFAGRGVDVARRDADGRSGVLLSKGFVALALAARFAVDAIKDYGALRHGPVKPCVLQLTFRSMVMRPLVTSNTT